MHMRNDGGSSWTGRSDDTKGEPPRDDGDEDNYGGF
jgi:hypothetical protein